MRNLKRESNGYATNAESAPLLLLPVPFFLTSYVEVSTHAAVPPPPPVVPFSVPFPLKSGPEAAQQLL